MCTHSGHGLNTNESQTTELAAYGQSDCGTLHFPFTFTSHTHVTRVYILWV